MRGPKILFLDDSTTRTAAIKSALPMADFVVTAKEAIAKLANTHWDLVLLDHDLGGETFVQSSRDDTGMEVVRCICRNKPSIDKIVIHSLNYPAASAMAEMLRSYGYSSSVVSFFNLKPWINDFLDRYIVANEAFQTGQED